MTIHTESAESSRPVHEIWAAIPGFSAYQASNLGRIRSLRSVDARTGEPIVLSPGRSGGTGYLTVSVRADGAARAVSEHISHLVAAAWLGERPSPDHCVLHANDIRTDNRAANLRYGTRAENHADALRNGGRISGPTPNCWGKGGTFTVAQVRSIRRQAAAGVRISEIAAGFEEVSYDAVWACVRGRTWSWVTDSAATTAANQIAAQASRDAHKAAHSAKRDQATIAALLAAAPPAGQVQRRSSHTPAASAPTSKGY